MTTAAVAIDKLTLTIDSLDVSGDVIKGNLTPTTSSGETITLADAGQVIIAGETTWQLNVTMLFNDAAAGFFRAKLYTKAGDSVAFTAVLNPVTETSTITGTVTLQPAEVVFGEPWGGYQQVEVSLPATVTGWTTT